MLRISSRVQLTDHISWDNYDQSFHHVESMDSLSDFITCYSRSNSVSNLKSPSFGYMEEQNISFTNAAFLRAESETEFETVEDKKISQNEPEEEYLPNPGKKRERNMLLLRSITHDDNTSILTTTQQLEKKIALYSDLIMVDDHKAVTSPKVLKREELSFLELLEDVQLHLLGFCTVQEILNVQLSCRYMQLLLKKHTQFWKELCPQVWPWCSQSDLKVIWNGYTSQVVNFPALFQQSSTYHPQSIHPCFAQPTPAWSTRRTTSYRPAEFETMKHAITSSSSKKGDNAKTVQVWQFKGTPGSGDRCIRSDQPFARPHLNKSRKKASLANVYTHHGDMTCESLLEILRFRAKKSKKISSYSSKHHQNPKQKQKNKWSPFVSPFWSERLFINKGGKSISTSGLNLAPRMISYFEVSILPASDNHQDHTVQEEDHFDFHGIEGGGPIRDCVAVGISTQDFITSGRMPGWDKKSYGYHSDDGGIFHAKGIMVKKYGPKYGVNDTVGCGVNYENNGIFFTLNGDFLGYAWENIKCVETELMYPTIGVDTRYPLAVNFGMDRSFMFDFTEFVACSGKIPKVDLEDVTN